MAGWQNDPNPVIGNPTVCSLKSTLTGGLERERRGGGKKSGFIVSSLSLYCAIVLSILQPVHSPAPQLYFHLPLAPSSFSFLPTAQSCTSSHCICLFSHHSRAPVLQERGVGGVSTRPLCSVPLSTDRDVQNGSQRQDDRSEVEPVFAFKHSRGLGVSVRLEVGGRGGWKRITAVLL